MDNKQKFKLINQGYSLGLFVPPELVGVMKTKILTLQKASPERWEAIGKGMSLGIEERTKRRQTELKQAKEQGRGRGNEPENGR